MKHVICYLCLCVFFIISCQKEYLPDAINENEEVLLKKLTSMGFTTDQIKECGENFIVQNDIRIPKQTLISLDEINLLKSSRTMSLPINKSYKVYIYNEGGDVNAFNNLNAALDIVVAAYNNIPSKLRFVRTASENDADIVITHQGLITCGDECSALYYDIDACYPTTYGDPGRNIRIGGGAISEFTQSNQYIIVLVHLLGHSVGIMHSDNSPNSQGIVTQYSDEDYDYTVTGYQILNTPYGYGSDPTSCMRSNYLGSNWTGFTNYDIAAIKNLFPNFSWSTFITPGTNATGNSDIALRVKTNGDKDVFYVNTSGNICVAYLFGSAWSSYLLNGFPLAKSTAGICWSAASNELYYVGNSNNTIYRVYINSSGGWSYTITPGTSVSNNSDLAVRVKENGDKDVFYINSSGYICTTYLLNGVWRKNVLTSLPTAYTNSSLNWNSNNQELYYIANNGTVCRAYLNNNSWVYQYTAGTYAATNSDIAVRVKNNGDRDVFYRAADGTLRITYLQNGSWGSYVISSQFPLIKSGSGFQFNNTVNDVDDLYFIGTDNKIYNMFVNITNWSWDYRLISRVDNEIATRKIALYYPYLYYINNSVIAQLSFTN